MYDRWVVRGNTFASIVIPSQIQPDPALLQKQKDETMMRQYDIQRRRNMRQQEDMKRQISDEEEEDGMGNHYEHNKNKWDDLSNNDDMEDERELEPDYYIDWPDTPEFIPNEKGVDKDTQVIDEELFDFELEVEPVL